MWYEFKEPLDVLTAEDFTKINKNQIEILELLKNAGYPISVNTYSLKADYSTEIAKMFDFFQKTEYNLDEMFNKGIYTPYYGEAKKIGEYAPNKWEIWRWIQMLNDLHEILTNKVGQWGYLMCTDGFPTLGGKYLILRGLPNG